MAEPIQTLIFTSDRSQGQCLRPFMYLWQKYFPLVSQRNIICGFTPPDHALPAQFDFYSIGNFEDYPPQRWSDGLLKVLDDVAAEVFILMFDDFWPVRDTDPVAIRMIFDYMKQFEYVLKFDLTTDRLYAEGGGKYLFGYNGYSTLAYLDLIKSSPGSPYHMSLWGGMWRRDLLRRFVVSGETAQQIELIGTGRLAAAGDEVLVLGTRQAPLRHANVIQAGQWNQDPMVGLLAVSEADRQELKDFGYL